MQGQETGLSDIFPDSDLHSHTAISGTSVDCPQAFSRQLMFGLSTKLICLNDRCHQDPDRTARGKLDTWRQIAGLKCSMYINNKRRKVIISLLGIVNFLVPCWHIHCDIGFVLCSGMNNCNQFQPLMWCKLLLSSELYHFPPTMCVTHSLKTNHRVQVQYSLIPCQNHNDSNEIYTSDL